ncbi:ribonuclease III [Amylibacter marinus]|uniref:Ribonuclease III n=1 Tax=Amylibacter marinus TaxID=1475483 RepID=A0ABQ5VSH0_9RHOB|nr:DUF2793 domain-containing protein [Amylibacter marinus]GLQ34063.1 ribonuclease III [Amylibacter marinus]
MFETNEFGLPLLQASQAQKHVTVNEAITRLDAMVQMRLESISENQPPVSPNEGALYGVAPGAVAAWAGQEGMLAVFSNGGWVFIAPKDGWRAWVIDQSSEMTFLGGVWVSATIGGNELLNTGVFGAATRSRIIEVDQVLSAGAHSDTSNVIPDSCYVLAVTTRVTEEIITDGATDWRLGLSWDGSRYGSGRSLSLNATDFASIAQKMYYYRTSNSLRLQPTSGQFVSGRVSIALHCLTFEWPSAV